MKLDVTQDIRYLVSVSREPGDEWPLLEESRGRTRYEVREVEAAVFCHEGKWETSGLKVMRGNRANRDGGIGPVIGMGHYYYGDPGTETARVSREIEQEMIRVAKERHEAYLRSGGRS